MTEAARNLTAGTGVGAMIGGAQHQRLEGSGGGGGGGGMGYSGSMSSLTSHEKASLLSSGSDGGYQRLHNTNNRYTLFVTL